MTGVVWSAVDNGNLSIGEHERHTLFEADIAHWAHNVRLWETWRKVNEAGSNLGIGLAVIKGIALESRYYARTGERPCTDLDLLIDPGSVERIEDLLLALEVEPRWAALSARMVNDGRIQSVPITVDGVSVDLHADLFKLGFGSRDPHAIWASVQTIQGPEGSLQTIDSALTLLHLLVHLNRDRFRRLLGYVDIQRIANSGSVAWDRFWEHARRQGLVSIAREVLGATNDVLAIKAPGVGDRLWTMRGMVWRWLWPPSTRLTGRQGRHRFGRRAQIFLPLLCKGRALEALTWLSRGLLPPSEFLTYNHPGLPDGPYLWRLTRARWLDRRAKQQNRKMEEAIDSRASR